MSYVNRQLSKDKTFEDKFYTHKDTALECIKLFEAFLQHRKQLKPDLIFVEPSCGNGAFSSQLLPNISINLDINPEYSTAIRQDFLQWMPEDKAASYVFIGNPPYGYNNQLVKKFLKHIDILSKIVKVVAVGFVLPSNFTIEHTMIYKHIATMFNLEESTPLTPYFVKPNGLKHTLGFNTHFVIYTPKKHNGDNVLKQWDVPIRVGNIEATKAAPIDDPGIAKYPLIGQIKNYKSEDIHFNYKPDFFKNADGKIERYVWFIETDRQDIVDFLRNYDWSDHLIKYMNNTYGINSEIIKSVLIDNGFGSKQGFDL